MRARALAVVVGAALSLGCPKLKTPERGTELRFTSKSGARAVVDRRLASMHVKARLTDDAETISVRVPEGEDVEAVVKVLAEPAKLELCPEDHVRSKAWCGAKFSQGVTAEPFEGECTVRSSDVKALEEARKSLEGRTAVGVGFDKKHEVFAVGDDCLVPRVLEGTSVIDEQQGLRMIKLSLDDEAAHSLEALTTRELHHRLIILLDGAVQSAPVVQGAVTGGKIAISSAERDPLRDQALINAIIGGPIEDGLVLTSQKPYGPPSLR